MQKRFIVRELGWCDADGKRVGTFHYTHSIPFSSLSKADKNTVSFVRERIHGMTFKPNQREIALGVHAQEQVKDDIVHVWNKCKTPSAATVAYKGGAHEKTLLTELRIPCINLEEYGCPKYNTIRKYDFNCGCHFNSGFHCSMTECYTFIEWLNKNV